MAIYMNGERLFVSPTQAKVAFDGESYGGPYVYEMNPAKREIFLFIMEMVPKAMLVAIAVLFYASVFVESELERTRWIFVMFLPAAVYFGALFISTTFPRRVCVSALQLRLSAGRDSLSFCWAQIAIFVPMIFAFVLILQMRWSYSWVTFLAHAIFGGFPALCGAFAIHRLRSVVRAR